MPSTYTTNNGIELIATGEQSGTWGETTNTNLELLDASLDGQVTVTLSTAGTSGSPNDLPVTNGSSSNGRNRVVIFNDGADLGATAFVQLTPNDAEKIMYIRNSLSGSRDLIVFQGTYNASNDYVVPNGTTAVVLFDGAGTGAVAANVFNNAAFDALQLGTSDVSVNKILDQDDMSGDDASALATQQSIKAYVDSQVGANNELSEVLANGNTTGGTDIAVGTGDDITFADSSKAIFGAGSDLQIYHDGTSSIIQDAGTGNLIIQATELQITNANNTANYIRAFDGGAVDLRYAGSAKLATTSTGIDVTGTIVGDGLTVDGDSFLKASGTNTTPLKVFSNNTATNNTTTIEIGDFTGGGAFEVPRASIIGQRSGSGSGGVLTFTTGDSAGTLTNRININDGGDISFYEDTGTTAKLFWDASAESLGIGTSSPTFATGTGLQVTSGSFASVRVNHSGSTGLDVSQAGGGAGYLYLRDNADLIFGTNNTERMRIDSSGQVGIGTDSPNSIVDIRENATGGQARLRLFNTDQTNSTAQSALLFMSPDLRANGVEIAAVKENADFSAAAGRDIAITFSPVLNNAATERMRIDSSGQVGIGTTSASSRLTVRSPDNTLATNIAQFNSQNGGAGFKFGYQRIEQIGATVPITFETGGSESMRIDSSGNVGIAGQTNPTYKLDGGFADQTWGWYLNSGYNAGMTYTTSDRSLLIHTKSAEALDHIKFATGTAATERMRIDSSGNVGVGTSDPDYNLVVGDAGTLANAYIEIGSTTTGTGNLFFGDTSGTGTGSYSGYVQYDHNTDSMRLGTSSTERMRIESSGNLAVANGNQTAANVSSRIMFGNKGTFTDSTVGRAEICGVSEGALWYSGTALAFYTNPGPDVTGTVPVERMRVDASGNVGIGTDSPSNLLDVTGSIAGDYAAAFENTNSTNGYGVLAKTAHTGTSAFAFGAYGGSNALMVVRGDGRVGIGISSVSSALHVAGSTGITLGAIANNAWQTTAIKAIDEGAQFKGTLAFYTHASAVSDGSPTERMRIDSNGVVSIGDTGSGSASRLYVVGASTNSNIGVARFNTTGDDESSSCIAVVKNSSSTSTSNVFIRFGVANYNSGCGQINANGTSQAAFGSFSDRRLKENITDLPNQLANITALRPVEFDYIESEGGGHQIGFIAQEVEEIYPDLVGERHDGMKTLTGINKMEARLIKAIQEQNELINDLRARVAQLEGAN